MDRFAKFSEISKDSLSYEDQGIIIQDDFNRASLGANWTSNGGGTFGVSSNKLSVDGGSTNSNTRLLIWNAYGNSNLESFTLTADITAGTISSTSYGVGFGLESNSAAGFKVNLKILISLNTGSLGLITFSQTGSAGTYSKISPKGLSISSGDILSTTIKFIKNKFIVTIFNNTNKQLNQFDLEVSCTSPYTFQTPNSYRHSIIAMGGLHYVDNYKVVSNDLKGVAFLVLGDSIAKGLNTSNIGYRYTELINNLTDSATQTNAGSGNVISDINVSEVLALSPKKILVHIGTNDIAFGGGLSTAQASYTSLVNSLVSAGYVIGQSLYLLYLLPRGGQANISVFNSWLLSTYGENAVVNVYDNLDNGSGSLDGIYTLDNVHPNEMGHKIIANILINRLNISSKPSKKGNYYAIVYSDDMISIASTRYRGALAYNLLDLIDEKGTPLNVRTSNGRGGGFIGSFNSASIYSAGGCEYISGVWYARATTANIITIYNGDFQFFRNTGLTVGGTFTPTMVASCSNGNWQFGGSSAGNSSAILEVQSTTKGFLVPRLTTLQRDAISSPAEGLEIYNSTLKKKQFYNGTAWETMTSS